MKYRDPETGEFKEIYFKAADTLPIGSIIAFGSDSIPTNWLLCDGREVSRETYKALFDKIGTHYGEGDGETTFNLPNLAGKVAVGLDSDDEGFDTLGNVGGEKEHTLTIEEMPRHSHKINGYYGGSDGLNTVTSNNATGGRGGVLTYEVIDYTGGNQSHNILQPYLVVNYIIKVFQSAGVVAEVENTESDSTKNTYSCDFINNKLNGTVLYENETGSNASITLSDSAANYSYIEIFFQGEGRYNSIKIPNANGKYTYLHVANVSEGNAYYKMSNWQISGSNVNLTGANQYRISSSGASEFVNGATGGNAIYITKVVGYK